MATSFHRGWFLCEQCCAVVLFFLNGGSWSSFALWGSSWPGREHWNGPLLDAYILLWQPLRFYFMILRSYCLFLLRDDIYWEKVSWRGDLPQAEGEQLVHKLQICSAQKLSVGKTHWSGEFLCTQTFFSLCQWKNTRGKIQKMDGKSRDNLEVQSDNGSQQGKTIQSKNRVSQGVNFGPLVFLS